MCRATTSLALPAEAFVAAIAAGAGRALEIGEMASCVVDVVRMLRSDSYTCVATLAATAPTRRFLTRVTCSAASWTAPCARRRL